MIDYFNSGYISRYLTAIVIVILIWIPSFILPVQYSGPTSYGYDLLKLLTLDNYYLLTVILLLISLLTALFLNKFSIDAGFTGKISTLVMVLYIIYSNALNYENHNNPIIVINFFLIFVWYNLTQLPYSQKPISIIFNASFLLGLASLFYAPIIFLGILILFSIIIHRLVNWRNFFAVLLGILLPYYLLMAWYFSADELLESSYDLFNTLRVQILFVFPNQITSIIILIAIVLLSLISFIGTLAIYNDKSINLRRNIRITLLYVVILIFVIVLFSSSVTSLILISVPVVLITSNWLEKVRNKKWYNISLLLITLIIIINQYSGLLSIVIPNFLK